MRSTTLAMGIKNNFPMGKISRINPLLEILRTSPRRVNKILLQKEGGRRPV